jgi:2,4-dienoyl-CoA reductase-like NADH-dependent reductase (Old Yellow Enzyme family)
MDQIDIEKVLVDFEKATALADQASFDVIELHMAHGYLFHQFLSPLSNQRKDGFGGSLENRMRFPLLAFERVRKVWPKEKALLVRISATDWTPGGWDLEQSVQLCHRLKDLKVDMIDCSSGGNVANAKIPIGPSYQVEFAAAIRKQCEIPTIAVGMILQPEQAESILRTNQADAICVARELLRDPYWPQRAAGRLRKDLPWPKQYDRAKPT